MRTPKFLRSGAVALVATFALAACGETPADNPADSEMASGQVDTDTDTGSDGTMADSIGGDGGAATSEAADREMDMISQDRSGSREFARIPAAFRGTWARDAAQCAARGHGRLTVAGDRISFFEDGGIASDIRGEGNALAVTYPFENPDGRTENRVVYFARESGGTMRVRRGDGDSVEYIKCGANTGQTAGGSGSAGTGATVPERFRGLYAQDRRACEEDYNYQPAFQNVTVDARNVSFFETGGPVTDVSVDGDNIAITLRETVGDNDVTRAIFLRLLDDGAARYRPDRGASVETRVRC